MALIPDAARGDGGRPKRRRTAAASLFDVGADAFGELADRVHVARPQFPVEQEFVVRVAGDDVEVEMEHGLPGGRSVRLREADPGRIDGATHGIRDPADGRHDGREGFVVRLEEVRRVDLRDDGGSGPRSRG